MSMVPEIPEFRQRVDRIRGLRDRNLVKIYYLTASRASELITEISPADLEHTKPYGTLAKWDLDDYKNEKVLVLKIAILKRKAEEVVLKHIGLPCDPKYEPWTLDVLRHIKKTRNITFPIVRQSARRVIAKYFPYQEGEKARKNILRHYRLTHLSSRYGFNAEDIITYAGWTFKGTFKSGQLDTYLHLDWRKYFDKLLRPLPQ